MVGVRGGEDLRGIGGQGVVGVLGWLGLGVVGV